MLHLGEGINGSALDELRCAIGGPLDAVFENGSVVHGMTLTPQLASTLSQRRGQLIWSPRSNIELYGNTAPAVMLDKMGVRMALGTDWGVTGSVNLLRELACAEKYNETQLASYFSDYRLWQMVTSNAAAALGVERKLGALRVGGIADIAVFDKAQYADHSAITWGTPQAVALVLRGGEALYGDAPLLAYTGNPWLNKSTTCGTVPICGVSKRGCISPAARAAAEPYLTYCGGEIEPSCVPRRSAYGPANSIDRDGDGFEDHADNCPDVFNPIRPVDQGVQPDANGNGIGDACDACPIAGCPTLKSTI